MIKLVADSAIDRPDLSGVCLVPLTMSTEERQFRDDAALNITEMLDYMAAYKGRSYTACPSVDAWLQAFAGGDEICVITITSGLSGSYNSAVAAKELYCAEHPNAKIHVFDSLSTGPEMLLILEKLKALTAEGLPFEEIVAQTTEYQKHTRLFFSLQSVHNLAQNGRVSKVVAAAVGMLSIRIVGTASPEGQLDPQSKVRGDNKALPELLSKLTHAGYAGGKIRITHVENLKLAERFAAMVREKWPAADLAVSPNGGLCSYYAERGAILVGIETA